MMLSKADADVYADALDCAAKLLAWKAARRRKAENSEVCDTILTAAAHCLILADAYREGKVDR